MKKDKNCQDSNCCCSKIFAGFEKQTKTKIEEAKKYIKKNPQKTKTIATGMGAAVMLGLAFLLGKNKNKKQDKD